MDKNWNFERWRTRDRLIDYDFNLVPPVPHSGGIPFVFPPQEMNVSPFFPLVDDISLPSIYPWENLALAALESEIFQIAQNNGYTGDAATLWSRFSDGVVHIGTIDTFPVPGNIQDLYLDKETNILYHFRILSSPLTEEDSNLIGAISVGENYIYIPVRALLIEDTISKIKQYLFIITF